jgi:hypothetical protein
MMRRATRLVFLACVGAPVGASAQQPPDTAIVRRSITGTISGSVIDATTGAPIARANVTLTSADGFGVLSNPRLASPSLLLARTVTTSATGAYRLADLPIGAYRLYVQRIGYAPATLEVRLGDSGTSPLSIGLVVVPVRLRAVQVHATDSDDATDGPSNRMTEDARVAAARARQRAYLSTDARELTSADISESATLGGTDILRSLQRLPGVTQLDDWSAKLWVRGNRWDHTRIYYDDLPLFDPLGALGQTSGVSADAIGAAFLHPGVRPVTLGGEGAARIDLRSRPAGDAGEWRGSAQLSRLGASGALEHERDDASAGFALTAQHTLAEWLPQRVFLSDALGDRTVSDAEVTARGDVDLGNGRRLETSGLVSRDARRWRTQSGAYSTSQAWGNVAGRVTFHAPLGALAISHTLGVSNFASSSDRYFAQPSTDTSVVLNRLEIRPVAASVDYLTLGGRASTKTPSHGVFVGGYDFVAQRSSFDGPRQAIYWGDLSTGQASRRDGLAYGGVWGDQRIELGERASIETGARLDLGGSSTLAAVRPAGSAQGRFVLSPSTWLSIGASRTHQYVQAIELPIVARGQTVPTLWLTSGGDVPMMSVDNAMAGIEHWMAPGVLVAANAYARHTTGAITDDPMPGPLVQRPLFVGATETAHGVELSARKLTGRTTALLAYSYGKATMDARGQNFPAPASRTHALDAATTVRLGAFSLGAAYTFTSGAPFTRTVFDSGSVTPEREAPNARRLPPYASLDVFLDYTRRVHGASLAGFAGLQNALGRTNPTWYQASGYCDDGQYQITTGPQCRDHDMLEAPVKFAPTIGLRIAF